MASDDVAPDEMSLFRPSGDPLDAALRGVSDDPAVDALVSDLRAAYLPDGTRPRSAALAAFAGTGDGVPVGAVRCRPAAPAVEAPVPVGRRVAVAAAAFAATLTGKVVLGGAVAAAALGGLHATDTVDVPLLPRSPEAQTVPSTVPDRPDEAFDPLSVLVGPPAQPPADAPDRTPAPDVPVGVPAPVAPTPGARSSSGDPAGAGDGHAEPGTRPVPLPPTAAVVPAPSAGQSDGPRPSPRAPRDPAGTAQAEIAPGADPAVDPDQEPPSPATGEQKTSRHP
jgi:hypothetical protein